MLKLIQTKASCEGRPKRPLSSILLFLLIAAVLTTGASFARYATTTSAAGTDARVAGFGVTMTADSENQSSMEFNIREITDTEFYNTYKINVNNSSEVAVAYDFAVTFNDPLPAGMLVKVGNSELTANEDRTEFTKTGIHASPNPTTNPQQFTLAIGGELETLNSITESLNSTVTVRVTATQID